MSGGGNGAGGSGVSSEFRRPETGIHTVEGNVAGSRAAALSKQREADQAEFEARKERIQKDAERSAKSIHAKFNADSSMSDAEKVFRDRTVGLVSAQDFQKATQEAAEWNARKKRERHEEEKEGEGSGDASAKEGKENDDKAKRKKKRKEKRERKKQLSTLSFADADDAADFLVDRDDADPKGSNPQRAEAEKGESRSGCRLKKDPTVDTSFLPDREREALVRQEKERLKREWLAQQEKIKKETLEITYSYWDGSGHRRTVQCPKGSTVGQFLELVRRDLAKEFREMGSVSADALLYVKEDLILPQDITFYDLIATKARGKSGPLFTFDVHDDVRVGEIDVRVEKDESHPGKVVERRWYDRHKHIFPASRWEIFDPTKDYGRYTIHGGEVASKK